MNRHARIAVVATASFFASASIAGAQPAPQQPATQPAPQQPAQQQPAAQPANPTYYVVTYLEVAHGDEHRAAAILRQLGQASRNEPGNLRFETLQRIGRHRHFAILEAWKDKAAAEAHEAAESTRQSRTALQPLLTAPLDERAQTALAVAAPQARTSSRAVYVITHVDIIPTQKDNGIAATVALAEPSRKQRGNLRFEVLQQANRPNHMTVVEVWRTHYDQRLHEATALMKDYRAKLLPMSGSLYDERLYRAIGRSR